MVSRILPPLAALFFVALAALPSPRPALSAELPAYMALGDSLAFGVGAQNPAAEGYVALTAAALNEHELFADFGVDLINLSEPAATSGDLLAPDGQLDQALAEIAARQNADETNDAVEIISVDIGGNDLLSLVETGLPCFEDPGGGECRSALNTVLSELQTNLTRVLTELRQAAPAAEIYVLDLYNPYSGTGEPLEIVAGLGVQMVNGVIAAVAANPDLAARFVSVYQLFQGRGQEWVAPDGIHPNNDGHRVIAAALEAAIFGRDIVLPPDIATPPATVGPLVDSEGSGDVSLTVLISSIVVAFVAGGFVSAAYFVVRGRR
jgi:lysophospholipase L1-like esterase